MVKVYDKFKRGADMNARHYSHNDYYEKGHKIPGIVFGNLSAELGLENGQPIDDRAFRMLSDNQHAVTGKRLTRHVEKRVVKGREQRRKPFCDVTCAMPKTFSVLAVIGGDERVKRYQQEAVDKVISELHRIVGRQNNTPGGERLERTGSVSGIRYCHDNNSSQECHIHDHLIIWNASKSANGKLYSIEYGEFANQSSYLTRVFWDRIAELARADGLNIDVGQYGEPQIVELIEMAKEHQQRSEELDAMVERIEDYAGTKLSEREKALIVRASRRLDVEKFERNWDATKSTLDSLKTLDPETAEDARRKIVEEFRRAVQECSEGLAKTTSGEVRAEQQSRVTPEQRQVLESLKATREQGIAKVRDLDASITYGIEHCFQQESVVKIYELCECVLQHAQGLGVDLVEMRAKIASDKRVVLGKHNEICSAEHYKQEIESKLMIRDGKGKGVALRYNADVTSQNLSSVQRKAVDSLLQCKDQFTALSGSSGVGKTERVLAEVIKANVAAGRRVAVVAPSDAARDVLRREADKVPYSEARGVLTGAVSLQLHMADQRLHEKLKAGDLLIIDEASMVSLSQGYENLKHWRERGVRILFSGDLDQAKSIDAGDFMRLAIGASIHTAELHEIRRQSPDSLDGHFLKSIQLFKKGKTTAAFQELLAAGCIHEIKGPARIEAMADAIMKAREDGVDAMCANFTHRENDAIAECVRKKMKLGSGNMLNVYSTLGWSDAQKKDISKLRSGMVIEITRGKDKGKAYRILPHDRGKVAPKGSVYARPISGIGPTVTLTSSNFKTFDVCEEKSIRVAIGEKLFARSSHKKGKLINGEQITVTGWDERFNPIDQNGRTVEHRNLCYGYASTSRKVQGSAATRVITGFDRLSVKAATKEVPYVINGRGREDCQIYVESIADLSQLQNRSGERRLATEMPTHALPADLQKLKDTLEPKARVELSHDHDGGRSYQQDYTHDHGHEMAIGYDL